MKPFRCNNCCKCQSCIMAFDKINTVCDCPMYVPEEYLESDSDYILRKRKLEEKDKYGVTYSKPVENWDYVCFVENSHEVELWKHLLNRLDANND